MNEGDRLFNSDLLRAVLQEKVNKMEQPRLTDEVWEDVLRRLKERRRRRLHLKVAGMVAALLIAMVAGSYLQMAAPVEAWGQWIYVTFQENLGNLTQLNITTTNVDLPVLVRQKMQEKGIRVDFDYRVPQHLPPGYELTEVDMRNNNLYMEFYDGSNFMSLEQRKGKRHFYKVIQFEREDSDRENVLIGPYEAEIIALTNEKLCLSFFIDDLHVLIFGKVPKEELTRVGNSLI